MIRDPKLEDWARLGVPPGSSRETARLAFVAQARRLHPDLHPDATAGERARLDHEMAALNEAWDRIEAWSDDDERVVPPVDAESKSPKSPTTNWTAPPGFRSSWVSGAHGRAGAFRLELTGSSSDLRELWSVEGMPVRVLSCKDKPLDDGDVAAVAALPELRSLDLDGTGVGDDALVALPQLPRLRDLHLCHTNITDGAFTTILRVARLHTLSLVGTQVTDEALRRLAGHQTLTILNVRDTAVRGPGLAALVGCPRLYVLGLPRIGWSDRRAFVDARPDVTLT